MASEGPNFPATGATFANAGTSENAEAWVNPGNIVSDNATSASITAATYDSPDISQILRASDFSFTIPAGSTIDGLVVEVDRSNAAGAASDNRIQLATGTTFSTLVGDNKAATTTDWPAALATVSYGTSTDDWNAGLTAEQINDPGFSVFLSVQADAANTDVAVDFIRVTVHYTAPAPQTIDLSSNAIASAEAVGTPSLILSPISVAPTAVDTAEALGTPTLLAGAVKIIVTAIASDEAVGSHTLALTFPTVNILPTGISSAESVGIPSLILANINISPSSVTSDEAVGAHTLKATSVVNPSAITTGEAVGSHTLKATASISPTGIVSGEATGTPTLLHGSVNIAPSGVTSGEATGTPTLLHGSVIIIVGGIVSGEAFGTPNIQAPISGSSISPTGISSQELFGLPRLIPGSVNIVAESAAPAEALGFPILIPGSTNIIVSGIGSLEAVGHPIVSAVVVGGPSGWGKVSRSPIYSTTKQRGWSESRTSLKTTRKNEGNR